MAWGDVADEFFQGLDTGRQRRESARIEGKRDARQALEDRMAADKTAYERSRDAASDSLKWAENDRRLAEEKSQADLRRAQARYYDRMPREAAGSAPDPTKAIREALLDLDAQAKTGELTEEGQSLRSDLVRRLAGLSGVDYPAGPLVQERRGFPWTGVLGGATAGATGGAMFGGPIPAAIGGLGGAVAGGVAENVMDRMSRRRPSSKPAAPAPADWRAYSPGPGRAARR